MTDGFRTRDLRDHNAALYQLSYGHRDIARSAAGEIDILAPPARGLQRRPFGIRSPRAAIVGRMTDTPSRLARRLTTSDAVVVGLGAMVGAGVFAALQPAAAAAGSGLLVALAAAGAVAFANATSSASLAALYPEAGGTYVYGGRRLGHAWGFLAGWAFVVGKTASCAAMALTFGSYAAPGLARPLAVAAVVALTAVNLLGVTRTALATRVLLALVLAALAFTVVAGLAGTPDPAGLSPAAATGGAPGVLQAAGFLFFAFAGFARIATLGEEVEDPARTIPRAIPLALGLALAVYAVVAGTALLAVGPERLAASEAPLVDVVEAGPLAGGAWVVRTGAAVAALSVLLSLIAGVGRTTFAMAANGDLPRALGAVHPHRRVPHRAELVVGAAVCALLLAADVRGAIGFSSFGVLAYYAIANASAWTLSDAERGRPRWLPAFGVVGCAALALSLPAASVAWGAAVLLAGALVPLVRGAARARRARGGRR